MNTPIADFVIDYEKKNMSRLHMPGHKGHSFLGCEQFDLTEVKGADALYEADGIIAESEANATELFGTGRTVYSTEGSSQCIRAMLYLVINEWKIKMRNESNSLKCKTGAAIGRRPFVVAARNVHKAFVYAAALLDFDVVWLWPEGQTDSICSCKISPDTLMEVLDKTIDERKVPPAAVYVTSPDYLGGQQDIATFADICHKKGTVLAVDNAHGAYLHFMNPQKHPIDLGVDICCDSAHKTLPVLTGGAYLQICKNAPESFAKHAKHAMALFGSTSPSYLILASLDLCNQYLTNGYKDKLTKIAKKVQDLREKLKENGWQTEGEEAIKLTIRMPKEITGTDMAQKLREHQIECEFADPEYVVFMFTPENSEEDFERIEHVFGVNLYEYEDVLNLQAATCQQVMSIRDAIFAEHEEISVKDALGRICASPAVSCPPAIPIVISGEKVDENAIALFEHYEIHTLYVVKEG